MDEAMRAVRESIEERHTYLLHLCELFITDAEPTSLSASQLQQSVSNTNVSALVQSPREIFRQWLRDVVKKNSGALRDVSSADMQYHARAASDFAIRSGPVVCRVVQRCKH
jgi:hypothetical protein